MRVKGFALFSIFILALGITFLGLYYNIQTVVLNEKMKQLKTELWQLKKENAHLEINFLSQIKRESLYHKATDRYGMIPEREATVTRSKVPKGE